MAPSHLGNKAGTWEEWTLMSGHFVGRIKGAKYRFDLQYLTWDFS